MDDADQLTVLHHVGLFLAATRGYAAKELRGCLRTARELSDRLGDTPLRYPVLVAQWRRALGMEPMDQTKALAHQILELAERRGGASLLVGAYRSLANTYWFRGDFIKSRDYADEGVRLRDTSKASADAIVHLSEPGISCLTYSAINRWFLGDPVDALKRAEQAVQEARELGHTHSLAVAMFYLTLLHQFNRDLPATRATAEEMITISAEQGFVSWHSAGIAVRGWCLVVSGGDAAGYELIERGRAGWQAGGLLRLRQYYWALYADAVLSAPSPELSRVKPANDALTEAIATIPVWEEHWWEPELYRLRAELLLTESGKEDEAEDCWLQRAIRTAEASSSVMLRRRAEGSLARLPAARA